MRIGDRLNIIPIDDVLVGDKLVNVFNLDGYSFSLDNLTITLIFTCRAIQVIHFGSLKDLEEDWDKLSRRLLQTELYNDK